MALSKFEVEEGLSVGIEIYYEAFIPVHNVNKILSVTESEVIRLCREELFGTLRELGITDRSRISRARNLFAKYQADTLVIQHIGHGSIIIEAAITAVCTWIVLNTVGESFKEAWKESDAHQRVKSLLNKRLSFGIKQTAMRIQSRLRSKKGLRYSENITTVESLDYPSMKIRVEYRPDENKYL